MYSLNSGQVLSNVHRIEACAGRPCCIHNPSDHHMVSWPMEMRTDAFAYGLMERFCEHGVGHPDPDSIAYLNNNGPEGSRGTWGTHGCDGCCAQEKGEAASCNI